jgi:REP element-mobilizing transposase RayT
MPNHVHVVIEIWEKYSLAVVLHSWKSYTAHEANRLLHRSGSFWFREYHDRFIRDSEHLSDAVKYVENNPVTAGLAKTKEEWPWGSAL